MTAIKIDVSVINGVNSLPQSEHGESFLLADGSEVDADIGNFERFPEIQLSKDNYITTGKVCARIEERKRLRHYRGKIARIRPHFVNEI